MSKTKYVPFKVMCYGHTEITVLAQHTTFGDGSGRFEPIDANQVREICDQLNAQMSVENLAPQQMRCVKCGSDQIGTRYVAAGELFDFGFRSCERAANECLRRLCRTCQYCWTTPVVGAPTPTFAGEQAQAFASGLQELQRQGEAKNAEPQP